MIKRLFILLFTLFLLTALLSTPCFAQAYDSSGSEHISTAILIGAASGVIVTGIFAGVVVYSYKRKLRSEIYPLDRYASLELTGRTDIFIGKFVTRRTINTGNSSRGDGRKRR
jgi:hypothetical protein